MSSLKTTKEHRYATLTEKSLIWYNILYIERSVVRKVNLNAAIEIFAEQKAKRRFTVKWLI